MCAFDEKIPYISIVYDFGQYIRWNCALAASVAVVVSPHGQSGLKVRLLANKRTRLQHSISWPHRMISLFLLSI